MILPPQDCEDAVPRHIDISRLPHPVDRTSLTGKPDKDRIVPFFFLRTKVTHFWGTKDTEHPASLALLYEARAVPLQ